MNLVLIISVFFLTFQNVYLTEVRLCARSSTTVAHKTDEFPDDYDTSDAGEEEENDKWETDAVTGMQYVQCTSQTHHCYALWQEDGNGSIIMGQGCWESSGKQDCERSQCVSDKKPPKAMNNTKFCCCSGNFCNTNVTDIYVPMLETNGEPPPAPGYLEQAFAARHTIIVLSVTISSLMFAFAAAVFVYNVWQTRRSRLGVAKNLQTPDQVHLMSNGYTAGLNSFDHLQLCSIAGQGRYGSVWKGTVNEQEVAVKIFPNHYHSYFYNERDIYCLPFMEHPCILSYFGCDERINFNGQTEYLLVLSYAPNGCLQDYLTENTVDYATFSKMALSIAKGIAHLHTDITKGDKEKPCVSHRDLNSRNILVKADLSCCICDLGFAMKISGAKYFSNGEVQHAETKSIHEVGTRRYMAPEVLEGSVNLRECESSLKQIDVYALGLVLWELATRCQEFYTVQEIPAYRLAFQQEIGLHPTLEQMQALVSRRKARPLFPVQWRDSTAARLVRDTAEDCWDQDAEARLTALCVEERLNELPLLRDRNNRSTIYSTSPTFNSNQSNGNIINNNNHLNTGHRDDVPLGQTPSIMGNGNNSSSLKDNMYDISESTVETLLSPTDPGDHPFPVSKNSNETAPYNSNGLTAQFKHAAVNNIPLQPYQGRNPCLERNLMPPTDSTDNLQYNSNLVDKSFKHNTHYRTNSNTTESQGLVTHDYLNQNGYNAVIGGNRPATPIPYVQNVYEAHSNLPKQHNTNSSNAEQQQLPPKPKSRWTGFRKLFDRNIFGRELLESIPTAEDPKSNLITDNSLIRRQDHLVNVMETQVNLVGKLNSNGVVTSVLHEDSIGSSSSSSSGGKRPSTLPLIIKTEDQNLKNLKQLTRSESNPIPVQKLTTAVSSDVDHTLIKCSDSTSGINQIMRHKNSLCKQQSLEQFTEVFASTSDLSRLKDPNQRIKTPGDVPPSVRRTRGKAANVTRFSLYDDRMMSYDCNQWSSVPDDIDNITVETETTSTILQPPEIESLKCNRDSVSSF